MKQPIDLFCFEIWLHLRQTNTTANRNHTARRQFPHHTDYGRIAFDEYSYWFTVPRLPASAWVQTESAGSVFLPSSRQAKTEGIYPDKDTSVAMIPTPRYSLRLAHVLVGHSNHAAGQEASSQRLRRFDQMDDRCRAIISATAHLEDIFLNYPDPAPVIGEDVPL